MDEFIQEMSVSLKISVTDAKKLFRNFQGFVKKSMSEGNIINFPGVGRLVPMFKIGRRGPHIAVHFEQSEQSKQKLFNQTPCSKSIRMAYVMGELKVGNDYLREDLPSSGKKESQQPPQSTKVVVVTSPEDAKKILDSETGESNDGKGQLLTEG